MIVELGDTFHEIMSEKNILHVCDKPHSDANQKIADKSPGPHSFILIPTIPTFLCIQDIIVFWESGEEECNETNAFR